MKQFIQKFLLSVLVVAVCLIPTLLFFTARAVLNPVGFWENFAVSALGFYILGFAQFVLLIVLVALVALIWNDDFM